LQSIFSGRCGSCGSYFQNNFNGSRSKKNLELENEVIEPNHVSLRHSRDITALEGIKSRGDASGRKILFYAQNDVMKHERR